MRRNRVYGMIGAALMLCSCANGADPTGSSAQADTQPVTAQEQTQQEATEPVTQAPDTKEPASQEPVKPDNDPQPVFVLPPEARATQYVNRDVATADVEHTPVKNQGLVFSHESGCYGDAFLLTIEAGGKIYFTLDGSDPETSENLYAYTEPIVIYDRSGDENVVSAVDPDLFDTANGEYNKKTGKSTSRIDPPKTEDVDKCTVIRAMYVDDKGNIKGKASKTYFVGDMAEHIPGITEGVAAAGEGLVIVSISMDYEDLFDYETGIYIKGKVFDDNFENSLGGSKYVNPEDFRKYPANYNQRGREWEREAEVTIFESDGSTTEPVISQLAGIRIQGNYSRSDLMKGFRLYARNSYGKKRFEYAIFGDDLKDAKGVTIDSFKTLTLRNGGNGAFANKFADTYWQYLVAGTNDVSTLHSRPAIVYLNGEYWGYYVLQEDFQQEYFEDHYYVNADDVVAYKGDAETYAIGYKLDLGELPEGETDEDYYLKDLEAALKPYKKLTSITDEDCEKLCELVDPVSFRDYFAIEIWVNNKWDWPGKNWSMWKTLTVTPGNEYADGRWRLCVYDIEFGGVSGSSDAGTNTIKEDNYKDWGLIDTKTDNPAVLTFAVLMRNKGFREDFYAKLLSLSENEFEKEHALEVLDWFDSVYAPYYEQFFNRYRGTGSENDAREGGYFSVKCIRDFLNRRAGNIQKMIDWVETKLGNDK